MNKAITLPSGIAVNFFSASLLQRWQLHAMFWIGYFLFYTTFEAALLDNLPYAVYAQVVNLPLQMGIVYFNLYVLLPRLLQEKKFWSYAASVMGAIALMVLVKRSIIYEIVYPATCPVSYEEEKLFTASTLMLMLVREVYMLGLTTAAKLYNNQVQVNRQNQELAEQKLEAELNFLKAQVNPHFFFNTLNNLYALTISKSDLAPHVVHKLSALMSYMLYETETQQVSLEKEVLLLQDYIDLERLRYGEELEVSFAIEGSLAGCTIPPLLLLPFIENSFKHSYTSKGKETCIDISLAIDKNHLKFSVCNSKNSAAITHAEGAHGLGLKNVRRRLDLLYADNYLLELEDKGPLFCIHLEIPLS